MLTSDDRIEIDEIINEIVDGYEKYDVQRRNHGDMTTYMLIIRRLVLTDAGTYTCQINVKASHIHPSKDGIVVVLSTFFLLFCNENATDHPTDFDDFTSMLLSLKPTIDM